MASASGVTYKSIPGLRRNVKKRLRRFLTNQVVRFCSCSGVPANDTAADLADANGDLCIDVTNGDLYKASSVTRGSLTTWTKIVG